MLSDYKSHNFLRVFTGHRSLVAGILFAAFICLGATGCSTFGVYQAFTYRKTYGHNDPNKVLTYSYDPSLATASRPFFKDAYLAAGANQKQVRNRILYELMGVIDDYYYRYTTDLRRQAASKGIFVDTAGIATSIAATAAGGNELKTILSGISSGVQGLSKSIDANVLLGNTIQAIRLQMDSTRAVVATDMITKMKQQDCADYPLEAGLRDIIRYYDAGTLTAGLAGLSKQAGISKYENEQEEKSAATGKFTKDSATDSLRSFWKPNGAVNQVNAARLQEWLNENEAGVDIATFLYSSKYASERPKAVAALVK